MLIYSTSVIYNTDVFEILVEEGRDMTFKRRMVRFFKDKVLEPQMGRMDAWEKMVWRNLPLFSETPTAIAARLIPTMMEMSMARIYRSLQGKSANRY